MSGGTVNFTAVMPDDLRVETARHEEGHLWVLLAGGRTTVQVEVTDDQARSLAQAILAALPPQPYQAEAMAVSEAGHEGAHASALSDVYGEDVAKCGPCADGQPCAHYEWETGPGGEQ